MLRKLSNDDGRDCEDDWDGTDYADGDFDTIDGDDFDNCMIMMLVIMMICDCHH